MTIDFLAPEDLVDSYNGQTLDELVDYEEWLDSLDSDELDILAEELGDNEDAES